MKEFRICISGSRGFSDENLVKAYLEEIIRKYSSITALTRTVFIAGGCSSGPDVWVKELCEEYNKEKGFKSYHLVRYEEYPADWDTNGKAAGPIRNEKMVRQSEIVICFWDGKSKGTKSTIDFALKHKKYLHVIFPE